MTATLSPTAKKNALTGKNTLVGYKLASDTSGSYETIPVSVCSRVWADQWRTLIRPA